MLTSLNVAEDATLKKAVVWCDEKGATSVSDIVEYELVDDFVRHLGLKPIPDKKLRSMLQALPTASSSSSSPSPQLEWNRHKPTFYFLPRAAVLSATAKQLKRMQELRDSELLEKMSVDLTDAFQGTGLVKNVLFVSHRWEDSATPDETGAQLAALQAHLLAHPEIQYVWFDYSCMPQRSSGCPPDKDDRTPAEKAEFDLMLKAIADLYLTAKVLILLDKMYLTRFWTTMEGWCAMQQVTSEGVRPATEGEARHTVVCIHNATQNDKRDLLGMSTKTPAEITKFLASPDVAVTNKKDKETMLPIVGKTDEHVREMMSGLLASQISDPDQKVAAAKALQKAEDAQFAAAIAASLNVSEHPVARVKRWGDGLEAPAAGSRHFVPQGFELKLDVPEAIECFGHSKSHVDKIMDAGRAKASTSPTPLAPKHAAALFAYTEETTLYGTLNYTMRTPHTPSTPTDTELKHYADYIVHTEAALSSLPTHVSEMQGKVYRGIKVLLNPDIYAPGKQITWQGFSSSTKKQTATLDFVTVQPGRKLQGSLFVIDSITAKDIRHFSAIPSEEEVLFPPNSQFKVEKVVTSEPEKKALLSQLGAYDMTDLDVYVLKQIA